MSATATPDLVIKTINECRDEVKRLRENQVPKAEIDEKIAKVAAGLDDLQKKIKEDVKRPSQGDPIPGSRGLAALGIKSLTDFDIKTGDPTKDRRGLQLETRKTGVFGETTHEFALDADTRAALETVDKMYLFDVLMSRKHGGQAVFAQVKQNQGGARNYYAERAKSSIGPFRMLFNQYDRLTRELAEISGKALSSTGSAAGDEWVPTGFASNVLEIVRVAAPTVGLFPVLNMPTNPFTNPIMSTPGTGYIRTENTAVTEGTMATANRSITAYTFANYQAYSDEASEDAIVSVLGEIQSEMRRVMAESLEYAIISGDADGANHFDNDYDSDEAGQAGKPFNSSFSGLRQLFLDGGVGLSVNGGGSFLTFALFAQALGSMGKYAAHLTNSCVGLLNTETYLKLLTENGSPLVTVDKYGPGATILTGELGRIFGVPILTSFGIEQRRNAVATTGMNDASGNTLSTALVFNRMNFRLGDRRDVRVETDKDITAGKNQIVSTARWGFMPIETPSTTLPAGYAFINID